VPGDEGKKVADYLLGMDHTAMPAGIMPATVCSPANLVLHLILCGILRRLRCVIDTDGDTPVMIAEMDLLAQRESC
jgi:hypothetical protein